MEISGQNIGNIWIIEVSCRLASLKDCGQKVLKSQDVTQKRTWPATLTLEMTVIHNILILGPSHVINFIFHLNIPNSTHFFSLCGDSNIWSFKIEIQIGRVHWYCLSHKLNFRAPWSHQFIILEGLIAYNDIHFTFYERRPKKWDVSQMVSSWEWCIAERVSVKT